MNTTELHKTFIDKVLHTINNMVLQMNVFDHFKTLFLKLK